MKDYYHILGVGRDAGPDEIKQSYRKLAKKYHPDKACGNKDYEERFKEIQEAYEALGNPAKRREYDELCKRDTPSPPMPAAPYSSRRRPIFRQPERYAAYNRARMASIVIISIISIGVLLAILLLTAAPKTYSTLRNVEPYRPGIPPPGETDAVPAIPGGKSDMSKDIQEEINIIQDAVNRKYDDFEKETAHRRTGEWERKLLDKDIERDIQSRLKQREKEKEMQQKYGEEWGRNHQDKDGSQDQ